MITGTFSDRQLLLKVIEGKEPVRSIEFGTVKIYAQKCLQSSAE